MGKKKYYNKSDGTKTVTQGGRIIGNLPSGRSTNPVSGEDLGTSEASQVEESGHPTLTAVHQQFSNMPRAVTRCDICYKFVGRATAHTCLPADHSVPILDDNLGKQCLTDLREEGYSLEELLQNIDILDQRIKQQELIKQVSGIIELEPPGSQSDLYDLDETGRPREIYYASFGSNLFAERFGLYIRGGQPEGSERVYPGCRDTAPPTDDIPVALNGTIYYAGHSSVWDGGVAFLNTESQGKSLGRAYRITAEQFDDVIAQENREDPGTRRMDLQQLLEKKRIEGQGAYGTLVHVGDYNGVPVVTFTAPFNTKQARGGKYVMTPEGDLVEESSLTVVEEQSESPDTKKPWPVYLNSPSPAYVAQITAGLAETHNLTPEQAKIYFKGSTGYSPLP